MLQWIKRFLEIEAAGGLLLLMAAAAGIALANSGYSVQYFSFKEMVLLPVNDGLMAVFFFMVGMEIKRECANGELSTWSKAILPLGGALGGVVVPAIVYLYFNHGTAAAGGWAIPSATDIAFSMGVLALFGKRVPLSVSIFLLALATIDDIAAILIIALYYTPQIHGAALAAAALCLVVLWKCNREDVMHPLVYIILGVLLWTAVHESGVHATLAGVALGLMIPQVLSSKWIEALHGWVAYAIIPLFAFINSGMHLSAVSSFDALLQPVPLGIALGLCVGKPLGIFATCFLLVKCRLAKMPEGMGWGQMWALGMIAGIGFTMSLFIGFLAFKEPAMQDSVRMGVVVGSMVSAVVGAAIFWMVTRNAKTS